MIRRPPRSTLDRSSAASDVYKRQLEIHHVAVEEQREVGRVGLGAGAVVGQQPEAAVGQALDARMAPVSYTHLRAHETVLDLVCRLLLEKTKK